MRVSPTHSNLAKAQRRHLHAALTHWSVVAMLMLAATLTLLSVSLALAVATIGELTLLGVLLRLKTFRSRVDAEHERFEAANARAALLDQMSGTHRAELEKLENLAVGIRSRCGLDRNSLMAGRGLAIEHWLELERLLSLYIRIAVAHRDATTSFSVEGLAALTGATEKMTLTNDPRGLNLDGCLHRRAAILQRRRDTWTQGLIERDLLMTELATIVDLVNWMHEVCALARNGSVRSEMQHVLASWEPSGEALREVSMLCRRDEGAIDPAIMALGRDELEKRAEATRREDAYGFNTAPALVRTPPAPPLSPTREPFRSPTAQEQAELCAKSDVVALRRGPIARVGGIGGGLR